MNGSVKFGTFLIFMAGVVASNGVNALDKNLWGGISMIVLAIIADIYGTERVSKGIKEVQYIRDLEKKVK